MGVSYSFPIVISLPNLIKGLGALTQYEFDGEGRGVYRYLPVTPMVEMMEQLPYIFEFIPKVEYDEDYILQCTLHKDGHFLTITIAAIAQRIFPFTEKAKYLFVDLELSIDGENYISVNHPRLPLLLEVLQVFEPIYGGTEGWSADPEGYWLWRSRRDAPWHTPGSSLVLGKPISNIVKEKIDLDSTDSGLYFVKRLWDELYFITSPDKGIHSQEVYKRHYVALRQVAEILEIIPVSILE